MADDARKETLMSTAVLDLDQRADLMTADWLVRVYTPTWLRLAELHDAAHVLESAAEITSWDALAAIMPHLRGAQEQATAAWDAARADARATAGDVAWATAGDVAWATAGDAAWDAVREAAWDAAWDVTWDAVREAAWEATWAATWAAAWAAARDTVGDAARAAARAAFKPAVERLQGSAIELYERMVALYEDRAGGQPRGAGGCREDNS